ncbi:YheC/YheD family protein [Paenibacillus sp. B2(2019)]|uniref:YheC/YheD family protein n=1 Tax=Paenibacillus sp. B2(2019) TaxID=2607754 RepID=UPI0011F0D854|nr:YheC/YheD family protein [Paenibacillus sp. B2(2019)]KAA1188033.1 YheC/YheD family protein [Paenibacillus sp. B2(2019)]
MKIQRVPSKWAKTKVILQNQSLSLYVPDTRKYDLNVLKEMLALYAMVYIKPDRGSFGIGVMRAEQRTVILSPSQQKTEMTVTANNEEREQQEAQVLYILRYAKTAEVFFSPEELHEALQKRIQNRTYLVQKGIDLLRHQDRPFDLRVLAQKTPSGAWETTGMLGRVAAPQKIVTNYHSGGSILSVNTLLKNHMNSSETLSTINQLKSLGVQIAGQLETTYPGIKEIGLDIAMDQHMDMWLLEVNTLPSIVVFKLFPDKSIYRRIHRYAVAYGRVKARKSPYTTRNRQYTKA